jgi:hypothetical protein
VTDTEAAVAAITRILISARADGADPDWTARTVLAALTGHGWRPPAPPAPDWHTRRPGAQPTPDYLQARNAIVRKAIQGEP